MCGIAGYIDTTGSQSADQLQKIAREMGRALAHRGPDASGEWIDAACGVALAHRRLSVIDLSPSGGQPMKSHCGRYVISFNGEIYNYRELRGQLQGMGHQFTGASDTEVILAACSQWGFVSSLVQLRGMFALALWDAKERKLFLARDRIGEKPLYYGHGNGRFFFASETRALLKTPGFDKRIDRDALASYLRFGYVPVPKCIFEGVQKLLPGSYTVFSVGSPDEEPKVRTYWSIGGTVQHSRSEKFDLSDHEATDELESLLRDTVKSQMVSDVPLGAFLSGGVDSATIVALMQSQSPFPVKTFTVGFDVSDYNEAEHARAVAQHLKTDHHELFLTGRDALNSLPKIPDIYDEPFADASQIPTALLAEFVRRHVTVSLSGDGGDETFAGYNRYLFAPKLWAKTRWAPRPLRKAGAKALDFFPDPFWNGVLRSMKYFGYDAAAYPQMLDKLRKVFSVLGAADAREAYLGLTSFWKQPAQALSAPIGSEELSKYFWQPTDEFAALMQFWDTMSFLTDDILVKVDRASMAVGLESRAPFLDSRVIEFAWRLPPHLRIRDGVSKWLLRQVLYRYVPQKLIERPKSGFSAPVGTWLRHELRDWAESLLSEKRLNEEGFFRAKEIRKRWREHASGKREWTQPLWAVLMFQAWNEKIQARSDGG